MSTLITAEIWFLLLPLASVKVDFSSASVAGTHSFVSLAMYVYIPRTKSFGLICSVGHLPEGVKPRSRPRGPFQRPDELTGTER